MSTAIPIPPALHSVITPPAISQIWPGQGGIYAGIARGRDGQPDYHMVLATAPAKQCANWQAAMEHAKTIEADGHTDFVLPCRWQAALLYANLRDQLTLRWHWTSTEHEGNASYAWDCNFRYGDQDDSRKSYEGCAVAVRCIHITA